MPCGEAVRAGSLSTIKEGPAPLRPGGFLAKPCVIAEIRLVAVVSAETKISVGSDRHGFLKMILSFTAKLRLRCGKGAALGTTAPAIHTTLWKVWKPAGALVQRHFSTVC